VPYLTDEEEEQEQAEQAAEQERKYCPLELVHSNVLQRMDGLDDREEDEEQPSVYF